MSYYEHYSIGGGARILHALLQVPVSDILFPLHPVTANTRGRAGVWGGRGVCMDAWMDGWMAPGGPWVKRYEWVCLTKSVDEQECEGKGVSHYESENNPMICRLLAALIDCLDRAIPGI